MTAYPDILMVGWGMSLKEILEIVIIILTFYLFHLSHKYYLQLKDDSSKYTSSFRSISFGLLFFFFSMLLEFLDNYSSSILVDIVQMSVTTVAFVFLLIGFMEGFMIAKYAVRGD